MFKKIYSFFVSDEISLSLEYQKKLVYLVSINCILVLFFTVMVLNRLFIAVNYTVGLGLAIFDVLYVCSLIFIKNKKYNIAGFLTLISCFLCANVIVYTIEFNNYLEIYKMGFFLLATIFIACLISFKRSTIVIFGILNCLSIILFFVYKVIPFYKNAGNNEYIATFLAVFIASIIEVILAYNLLSLSQTLVKTAENESKKNEDRLNKMEVVFNSSKKSFLVGENLINSSGKSIEHVNEINNMLLNIKSQISILTNEIDTIFSSNKEIKDAAYNVKNIVVNQNTSVEQSSTSVGEMSDSMKKISALSKTRKDSIINLVETTKNGELKMVESSKAMEDISKSAEEMLEIVKVIIQVAGQTNLLAMNASIEAAHAGDYGHGFSVVANEIRSLADETNLSTKEITSKIKNNQLLINNARDINSSTLMIFQTINMGVNDVLTAMDEVISSFDTLSNESVDIISAMSNLTQLSKDTNSSIVNVEEKILKSNDGITNVSTLSQTILQTIDNILTKFINIINEVKAIDDIGKENIKNISMLENDISNTRNI